MAEALLDGAPVDPRAIPLDGEGRTHRVRIVMGEPAAAGGASFAETAAGTQK